MSQTYVQRFLSVNDFAKVTSLSTNTIYRLIHRGEIEATKFGKSWRIPIDELTLERLEGGLR